MIHHEQLDTQVRFAVVFFRQVWTCLVVKTAKRVSILLTNVSFLRVFWGPSTRPRSAPAQSTLNQSQQRALYASWALINKLGIWIMNTKFMSMEIHQTSLTACAGDQLSRKAMCEQMNFSGSQGKHLQVTSESPQNQPTHLWCLVQHRQCYTWAFSLLCSHQDVSVCSSSLVSNSTGVPGTCCISKGTLTQDSPIASQVTRSWLYYGKLHAPKYVYWREDIWAEKQRKHLRENT